MDLNEISARIRKHTDSHKMGMIASHLGLVRGSSRNGRKVVGIEVAYDQKTIDNIINQIKDMPGIVEVMVEINEGRLDVGDEILFVTVGGDIRENVFPALVQAVDLIKRNACRKKEIFVD
ncbi:molybdenum cofactor biosynthesis protein MoaE [Deltaproteobacteria bacterium]|nr:molybdenum cofactor biosynthesis protein MoaE [Deltaproteobacteria bacterium]